MRYISTRGVHSQTQKINNKRFCDILLEGLAEDGGLYLPEHYPQVDGITLQAWRTIYQTNAEGFGYADLAFAILSLYIDDIPSSDLQALCRKTYTAKIFGTSAITPLKTLEPNLHLQSLSNGPTLAFKDMAMQLLGNLFEYELTRRNDTLNIFGATSGDTGSAAEYAMRGKKGIRVFMTSPKGRMSTFQQAQMFSLMDDNIHNIAIDGVFDDCQDLVKAVSGDLTFKTTYKIGTVNSINWARLLAQVVYYFAGYFQATKSSNEQCSPVSFTVPSGNFGNVCAGHVARMMGLPIDKLVVATNENNVLDEFFRTGVYRVRGGTDTFETSSPSMDISKASNFERFVFDFLEKDGEVVADLFGKQLQEKGFFDLSQHKNYPEIAKKFGFSSGSSTHVQRLATIQHTHAKCNLVVDPHTADGLKVAVDVMHQIKTKNESEQKTGASPPTPMIVLETALPIKFASTIIEALNQTPVCPPGLLGIEDLPKRVVNMAADVVQIKAFIVKKCQ